MSYLGYLIHERSICDPSISLNRDSSNVALNNTAFSVGPSGKHYPIVTRVMHTDGFYYTVELYSYVFELTATDCSWATLEERASSVRGIDGIHCTGFSCVQDCSDTYDTATNTTIHNKCINSYPRLSVGPNSTRRGDTIAALVEVLT
jgi:hypothetical protein